MNIIKRLFKNKKCAACNRPSEKPMCDECKSVLDYAIKRPDVVQHLLNRAKWELNRQTDKKFGYKLY